MSSKRFGIRLVLVASLTVIAIWVACSAERSEQDHPSELTSEKLAYVTDQGIYLVNPDGSRQVFLGHSLGGSAFTQMRWSPDGTQIAYNVGDLMWSSADLYVLNADGTDLRFLTEVPPNASWAWSPDSQYITINRSSHMGTLYYTLIQVESGESVCQGYYNPRIDRDVDCLPVNLSDGRLWSGHSYNAIVTEPAHRWALTLTLDSSTVGSRFISPDEEWVAFNAYNYTNSQYSWHIARSNGDELRTLYSTAVTHTFCYDAAWSTDSQNLAFSTYDDNQASIWTTASDDGSTSLLVRFEEQGCPDRLKWSTSGPHIGFSIYGHSSHRYVVNLSSGELIPVSPEEIFGTCEWSPDGNWLGCISIQSIAVFSVTDGRRFDIMTADSLGLVRTGRLAWSSTGRWFAVNTHIGIYSFDTITHRVRQVTIQEARGFAWSPLPGLQ